MWSKERTSTPSSANAESAVTPVPKEDPATPNEANGQPPKPTESQPQPRDQPPPPSALLQKAAAAADVTRVVKIVKQNEPLGATVRNEGERVVIGRVVKGGAAERSGQLRPGDEVLEVNGLKLKGKSVHDICDTLCQVLLTRKP